MDKWGCPDSEVVEAGTIEYKGKRIRLLEHHWKCGGKPEWEGKCRLCKLQASCEFSCPYGIPNSKLPSGFMNELCCKT